MDIVFPDSKQTLSYSDLNMRVKGKKYTNQIVGECEVTLFNLTREHRDYIITNTSPLVTNNRVIASMNVLAGRVSTGMRLIFTGTIAVSNITQPPDIGVILQANGNNLKAYSVLGISSAPVSKLSVIAKQVALNLGLNLYINVKNDINISNFYITTPQDGVNKLNEIGTIKAWTDTGTLYITDINGYLADAPVPVNENTGMIGIPQLTMQGVIVKVLFDINIKLGARIQLTSTLNKAANGVYTILQMDYELCTRDTPFYLTLNCSALKAYQAGGV